MRIMKARLCTTILFVSFATRAVANGPYCINDSSIVWNYENQPSIIGTFINCLENIQDEMIAPYYDTTQRINVSTEVFLNNLISVNEVSSTVTFDFFFNTIWVDHRLQMPALWDAVDDPDAYANGVDISEAAGVTNVQGVQPSVWLPDIVFPDAISIIRSEEYLKLFTTGELRRMQHFVMTFSESGMQYHDYPCDTQNITISFYSYTLTAQQLIFTPITSGNSLITPPVDFIYPQGSSTPAFAENPVWSLLSTGYKYVTWQLSPGLFARPFGIVTFTLQRKSSGILNRLCMPVLLIMLLCALSYWGTVNDRIATTVTGLLAIAALYIAVVGAIPLVGYMTRLDIYMFIMFCIIFTNAIFHMIVVRLNVVEKGTNWPLRKLTVRIIEFAGRVTMIPWIILTYIGCFWPAISVAAVVVVCISLVGFEYLILARYLPEIKTTIIGTAHAIEDKQGEVKENKGRLSVLERYFLSCFPRLGTAHISVESGVRANGTNGAQHNAAGVTDDTDIEMQETTMATESFSSDLGVTVSPLAKTN